MQKILIVDDGAEVQKLLQISLKRKGDYDVVAVSSGVQAIEATNAHTFDAIIMDVMMPEMDGYEVVRRLRANARTAQTPIIMLTARTQQIDQETALKAGADAYFGKPAEIDQLIAKINELIANRVKPAPPIATAALSTAARAKVTCVIGVRGGVGATLLATNIAATYARKTWPVCLIDLTPTVGHASLVLRLAPKPSLADLPAAITPQTVAPLLQKHVSSLSLLSAPPNNTNGLSADSFNKLSQTLSGMFKDVIINLSTATTPDATMRVMLATAHRVVLTFAPEMSAVQSLGTVLTLLATYGISSERIRLIVNHYAPNLPLSLTSIEKALGRSVDLTLPFEPLQAQAITEGIPIVLTAPGSQYSINLVTFLTKL